MSQKKILDMDAPLQLDAFLESIIRLVDESLVDTHRQCHDDYYFFSSKIRKKMLYKTQTCESWRANRGCPYGDKCCFVHPNEKIRERPSEEDLQKKIHVSWYKQRRQCLKKIVSW